MKSVLTSYASLVTPKIERAQSRLNNVVTVRFLTESCLLMTFLKSDNAELCEMVIDNKLAKAIAKCQRAKILPVYAGAAIERRIKLKSQD